MHRRTRYYEGINGTMILKQAQNTLGGLLLVLITILAVACTTTGSDDPTRGTPSNGIPTVGTPGELQPTITYTYHPNITLGPRRGKAGTEVTVVGGGFPASREVQIRLTGEDTGAPDEYITKTEAGQHGNIQVSFTMPERWPSGEPITIPRVTILASTSDFSEKAAAVFTYESNVTPEVTSTDKATPVAP
jgi:hypothetical protein